MSSSEENTELVIPALYERAYADFGRLGRHLPEESVVSLASEVLVRLTQNLGKADVPANDIEELSTALLSPDAKAAANLIEDRFRKGVDVQSLYLQYLSPAALRLGTQWESDNISFADVTVGTGRIYAIMRNLARRFPAPPLPEGKHALFANVPGDNHTLGVKMAADLTRKVGWQVDLMLDPDHDKLIDAIGLSNYHIVGLSGAGEHALPSLARLVLALRVSAPRTHILISGNIVEVAGDKVELMDVDAMARTFEEAKQALDTLWTRVGADQQ
ncbi:MAG: cobalamin B12-binding domain-containing protein [Sulfitobacter sp.]|nr:cobalamin B12-binding domain-containing protein [Sulfitobacter sp.]